MDKVAKYVADAISGNRHIVGRRRDVRFGDRAIHCGLVVFR